MELLLIANYGQPAKQRSRQVQHWMSWQQILPFNHQGQALRSVVEAFSGTLRVLRQESFTTYTGEDMSLAQRPGKYFQNILGNHVVSINQTDCCIFSQDLMLHEIQLRTGLAVISVEYRLAPEHPWPAALEDCIDMAEWLLENAQRKVVFLSVSTLIKLRMTVPMSNAVHWRRGEPFIQFLVPETPFVRVC